jgi:hypothetical protein
MFSSLTDTEKIIIILMFVTGPLSGDAFTSGRRSIKYIQGDTRTKSVLCVPGSITGAVNWIVCKLLAGLSAKDEL